MKSTGEKRSIISCVNSAAENMNSSNFLTVSRDVEMLLYILQSFSIWKLDRSCCASSETMKTAKFVKAAQRTKIIFIASIPVRTTSSWKNRSQQSKNRKGKEMVPSSGD